MADRIRTYARTFHGPVDIAPPIRELRLHGPTGATGPAGETGEIRF
jgi:hypothetical protein